MSALLCGACNPEPRGEKRIIQAQANVAESLFFANNAPIVQRLQCLLHAGDCEAVLVIDGFGEQQSTGRADDGAERFFFAP